MVGEIRYSLSTDPYSFIVHEIAEQMLSQKAAKKIFERVYNLCNGNICVENISQLSDEQLRTTGMALRKVCFIRNFTNAVKDGSIVFSELSNMADDKVIKKLASVKGIGTWTAKMYLIFCLGRQDILPTEDVAFLQGYKWLYKTDDVSADAVTKKCKKWKPYSSIAARYLYRALDTGLVKTEFHLFK